MNSSFGYKGAFALAALIAALAALFLSPLPVLAQAANAPTGTIPISLTDQGIKKEVGQAPYGDYNVVITNNSSRARGLVFAGMGLADTPYQRYTNIMQPGGTTSFSFFFAPGKVVLRDYLSATRTATSYTDVRYGPFSSSIIFTVPEGAAGAGPAPPQEVGAVLGTIPITITDQGIRKQIGQTAFGDYVVKITNNSSRSRGLLFSGIDLCCTRYYRFSQIVRPGDTTSFRFFFAPGKVVIRDFLSARRTATAYSNVRYGPFSSSIIFE